MASIKFARLQKSDRKNPMTDFVLCIICCPFFLRRYVIEICGRGDPRLHVLPSKILNIFEFFFQYNNIYVSTIGDFKFHWQKSFPNSKISKVKTVNWRFFQKHSVSLHVLPSRLLNIFEKILQYNKIYVSRIERFQFSTTKVIYKFTNFESENG